MDIVIERLGVNCTNIIHRQHEHMIADASSTSSSSRGYRYNPSSRVGRASITDGSSTHSSSGSCVPPRRLGRPPLVLQSVPHLSHALRRRAGCS